MYTFSIYCLLTTLITFYFFYSLYLKESQLFVFVIYLVKSKFYFCLMLNFGLMNMIVLGKLVVKVFFGEVRLSEMIQVIEKIRMKFITFLLLFLTFRPTIDISKIAVVVVYHCMSILNMLTFKRSAYLVSSEEKSKRTHFKILTIYIIVGSLDYFFYNLIHYPIDSKDFGTVSAKGMPTNLDSLIYYIFACEFIFLLIKMISKFIKLIIDLTQINMQKHWNLKLIVFNIISFIRYAIKLAIEIRFCIVLVKLGVVPVFFIIDVFYSCWNLIKLGYKFWENYKTNKHIASLEDYMAQSDDPKHMTICNICLDEIKVGKLLNCGHIFHLRCIKEWVTTNAGCPLCKMPIATETKPIKRFFQNNQQDDREFIRDDENLELDSQERRRLFSDTSLTQSKTEGKFAPPRAYSELKKFKTYQKVFKTMNWVETTNENPDSFVADTGAVSFALPCEAVYNRTIKNEIKRLEIEIYNRKLLEMYDNPSDALNCYEEDLKKIKNKLN